MEMSNQGWDYQQGHFIPRRAATRRLLLSMPQITVDPVLPVLPVLKMNRIHVLQMEIYRQEKRLVLKKTH